MRSYISEEYVIQKNKQKTNVPKEIPNKLTSYSTAWGAHGISWGTSFIETLNLNRVFTAVALNE